MKRLSVACLMLLVLATAGCGGSDKGSSDKDSDNSSPKPSDQSTSITADVVAGETGVSGGNMYAFLRNNENREVSVEVRFTAYNSAGARVERTEDEEKNYNVLPPSSTTLIAEGPASREMVRATATVTPVKGTGAKRGAGKFTASTPKLESGFNPKLTVEITNSYPQAVETAVVAVACRDAAGKILNVSSTQFSAPAGGTVTEVLHPGIVNGVIASCEAFPRIMSYTDFN